MTLTHPQAPVVCEKNIFHLFRSTQPVENHPFQQGGLTQPSPTAVCVISYTYFEILFQGQTSSYI